MNTAYLCLGGNTGNREKHLEDALALIRARAGDVKSCSAFYETDAWGVSGQDAYLNCCVELATSLPADVLMAALLDIEKTLGRERTALQYAPRTVDIDILFFNSDITASDTLTVPHPRLHLRRFVLAPMAELAAGFVHPVLKQTMTELLQGCSDHSRITLYKENPCISA